MIVKIPAWRVSSSVPAGGHTARWARIVKSAAKRPEKNINSEPSQIMIPIANIGGRSCTIFWRGAGGAADTVFVTGSFLVQENGRMPN